MISLLQKPVNYNPWSISGVPSVFVIKLHWNIAMLIHLCIVYGCFCAKMVELSNCDKRPYDPQSPKYSLYFYRKSLLIP